MDFSFWKKLLHVTVVILCGLSVVTGLSSCEEDFDPWEIATLEMRGSQEVNIPNNGSAFTIDINSNTKWTIQAPEWITVDKICGEGKATINATVPENKNQFQRSGFIIITAESDDKKDNVAGHKTLNIFVEQAPAIIINIINSNVERIQDKDYVVSNGTKYFYHTYKATIKYEIETNLTDEELAEIVKNPYMSIDISQRWSFSVPGSSYTFNDYITIENIPFTNGTHTVISETENMRWGNYAVSANVKLCWTESSSGNKVTGINYDFDVNDTRN